MKEVIIVILTFMVSLAIIKLIGKKDIGINKTVYRQSDMHFILKSFFSRDIKDYEKQTQITKRTEENAVRIIAVDDMAYWVVDNVFYVADIVDNQPDLSTARPIDTSNMSKKDIDKMLFILDNLGKGKKNDSSSSGE